MIEAANIFANPNLTGQKVSASKPTTSSAQGEQQVSARPARKQNPQPEKAERTDGGTSEPIEEPKHDAQTDPSQVQTNQPADEDQGKTQKDSNDQGTFGQLMAEAMAEPVEKTVAPAAGPAVEGEALPEIVETAGAQVQTPAQVTVPVDVRQTPPIPVATTPATPQPQAVATTSADNANPTAAQAVAKQATSVIPESVATSSNAAEVTPSGLPFNADISHEQTSGRSESSPLEMNTIQAEIPRTTVEPTASSTVASTAAPEINPNPGDSGTMTPDRPVISFSEETTATDETVTNPVAVEKPAVSPANLNQAYNQASSDNPQSQSQTSSNNTQQQAPSNDTNIETETQAFVPPVTNSPAQNVRNEMPVEETTETTNPAANVVENVADVAEASTTNTGRDTNTQVEAVVSQWQDADAPVTTTTAAGDVAAVAETRGAKVAEQITTHIQMKRDNLGEEMVIRLDPPELGKVRIQLRMENGELAGVIRTDNQQTHAELQRETTSLIQRLNDAGVEIKTLDLQMNNDASQGRGDQSFAQQQNAFSMFQQHNGGGRGYGNPNGQNELNPAPQDDVEVWDSQTGQYVSDSALNVML